MTKTEEQKLNENIMYYRIIKKMISEKNENPKVWQAFTIQDMEDKANEVYNEAFLHIPVEHFESIELLKKRLNPNGYDII